MPAHTPIAPGRPQVVARVLERRPGDLEEQSVLRVQDGSIERCEPEEARVEVRRVLDDAARLHIVGQGADLGRVEPGEFDLLVAEMGDRIDALLDVVPEGLDVRSAGEAPHEADDGDARIIVRLGLAKSNPSEDLRSRVIASRCRCARSRTTW
jgi:hypothetical protein